MTDEGRAHRLILRGGLSAGGGLAVRLGARIAFLIVAAQLFGAALFGAFSLAVAVVEVAAAVAALGMKRYLFRLLEEPGERSPAHVLLATLRATVTPTATDTVAAFFGRADLYLVGVLMGETAAGIYAMARQLKTPIRQVRQAFDGLLTPIVARTLSADGPASTSAAIATATRMILAIQLALVLTVVALGEAMLDWFGAEFAAAYLALLLLATAETIQGAFSVSDLLLLYLRARLALWVIAAMIVVNVATAVPLIAAYGIDGAALSVLLAIVAGAILRRALLKSRFGLAPPLAHSAGPLLAAMVAGVAAVAVHRAVPIHAAPPVHLGALAGVLLLYWACLWVWQRTTGETLRLTGFRVA